MSLATLTTYTSKIIEGLDISRSWRSDRPVFRCSGSSPWQLPPRVFCFYGFLVQRIQCNPRFGPLDPLPITPPSMFDFFLAPQNNRTSKLHDTRETTCQASKSLQKLLLHNSPGPRNSSPNVCCKKKITSCHFAHLAISPSTGFFWWYESMAKRFRPTSLQSMSIGSCLGSMMSQFLSVCVLLNHGVCHNHLKQP